MRRFLRFLLLVDFAELRFRRADNRPDITAETITADGWLKTGDVGQWNPDGTLSIIDRKKNLVKLAGGECSSCLACVFGLLLTASFADIALERLESVYKSCGYVSNICLHADSSANKAMAVRSVFLGRKLRR